MEKTETILDSIPHENGGITYRISCTFWEELTQGDSLCICGVCHTVEKIQPNEFQIFSSQQTLEFTSLGKKKTGDPINIERSLQLGARIHGHFVYGHIDFCSRVIKVQITGKTKVFVLSIPPEYKHYIVPKGSVTLDGVSLTIQDILDDQSFSVMLIPHTLESTTLDKWRLFSLVNVELDMLGKYALNKGLLPP